MKNKLMDLNDHLFAQIERLSDEGMTAEQIGLEVSRGSAIVDVADKIIRNAELQLKAAALISEYGAHAADHLPMIGGRK